MNARNTEELVRKCFYSGLNYRISFHTYNPNSTFEYYGEIVKLLARASRKFVRLEQAEKNKIIRRKGGYNYAKAHAEAIKNPAYWENRNNNKQKGKQDGTPLSTRG